jgi:hypothetical protein
MLYTVGLQEKNEKIGIHKKTGIIERPGFMKRLE